MLLSTRPPPRPQMENQRLLRPHLRGATSVAHTCCRHGPWVAGSIGLRALSWRALLSFAPLHCPHCFPAFSCFNSLRDVNSLKLLIKNILLSPPKVCFPAIFLLEGEMGGRGTAGKEWRSGLPGSSWRTQGGPCPVSPSLAAWLCGGNISEGSNPGCRCQS